MTEKTALPASTEGTPPRALVFAMMALGACAAEVDYQDGIQGRAPPGEASEPSQSEPEIDSKLQSQSLRPFSYTTPYFGGKAGSIKSWSAPDGAVIDAVQVRSGKRIDAVRFAYYVPEHEDHIYRGEEWWWSPWIGGPGGTEREAFVCPEGTLINGFDMDYSDWMNTLRIHCADNLNPTVKAVADSPRWGSIPGGNEIWNRVSSACNDGYLSTSFSIRTNNKLISGMQTTCVLEYYLPP